MKTIGYLVNTFLRPSETFIYSQVKNIKEFNIEVLTRNYINQEKFCYPRINCFETQNKIKYFINYWTYTVFRNSEYFEQVIKNKNVSLIHAHYGVEGTYALKFKKKFKLPLITTFYGHDITRLPSFTIKKPSWFNYWLYFSELKENLDLGLGNCEFITKKLLEKGFKKEKVKTYYLGIDIIPKYIKKYNTKNILTVGRLVEKKGFEYLIKAMKFVLMKHNDAILNIVGDGELKNKLKLAAKKYSVEKNIIFSNWQNRDSVYKLMQESKIFVLPSVTAKNGDTEGLPTVIMEAMSNYMPVVSTYHAGIPEIVENEVTGFLVKEKDYKTLAEKIVVLLSDGSLAEKMGTEGRKVVEEKFNMELQIKKLEQIYRNFI